MFMNFAFRVVYNFLSGLIFALQFFSFFTFCIYCTNEVMFLRNGTSLLKLLGRFVFKLCVDYGIIQIVNCNYYEETSKTSKKVIIYTV